jgi:hypothetical protein
MEKKGLYVLIEKFPDNKYKLFICRDEEIFFIEEYIGASTIQQYANAMSRFFKCKVISSSIEFDKLNNAFEENEKHDIKPSVVYDNGIRFDVDEYIRHQKEEDETGKRMIQAHLDKWDKKLK